MCIGRGRAVGARLCMVHKLQLPCMTQQRPIIFVTTTISFLTIEPVLFKSCSLVTCPLLARDIGRPIRPPPLFGARDSYGFLSREKPLPHSLDPAPELEREPKRPSRRWKKPRTRRRRSCTFYCQAKDLGGRLGRGGGGEETPLKLEEEPLLDPGHPHPHPKI